MFRKSKIPSRNGPSPTLNHRLERERSATHVYRRMIVTTSSLMASLYNYIELREQLKLEGVNFQTVGHRVLLAAYAHGDPIALSKFIGHVRFCDFGLREAGSIPLS